MFICLLLLSTLFFSTKHIYLSLLIINSAQVLYLDHLLTTCLNII